jgi:Rrf2 family nitric oxide-sensitive transcriptional repressor
MRLTTFSDYSLRVLIYLGTTPGRLATIDQIAAAYGISGNHLMKVVHHLGRHGYVETLRGKGGGMRLARPAKSINVGEVVRATEDGFDLVECFERGHSDCRIARVCVLKHALGEALEAFLGVLDRYTLADLLVPSRALERILVAPGSLRARPARGVSSRT